MSKAIRFVCKNNPSMKAIFTALILTALAAHSAIAQKRLVLIDQDGSGPGGSNQMAMMVLLQSPKSTSSASRWSAATRGARGVQHTLRMLELIHRTDVPVVPGAVFPLVRNEQETRLPRSMASLLVRRLGTRPTTLTSNRQRKIPPPSPSHQSRCRTRRSLRRSADARGTSPTPSRSTKTPRTSSFARSTRIRIR